MVQVEGTMPSDSKFLFRKNYGKYEFFRNPMVSVRSLHLGLGFLCLTVRELDRDITNQVHGAADRPGLLLEEEGPLPEHR